MGFELSDAAFTSAGQNKAGADPNDDDNVSVRCVRFQQAGKRLGISWGSGMMRKA